jgi:hypothetical protein
MFDLVINILIIFFIILFTNIIIQKQQSGDTLEDILTKYTSNGFDIRTYVKIVGIILVCWLTTINLYLGVIGAVFFILIMEYEYNNEIDKSGISDNTNNVSDNKLPKKDKKIDYFTAENNIKSKPSSAVDKSIFKSTSTIDPYDTGTIYNEL